MQLYGITRFNLVTQDLERLVAFYRSVLGMAPIGTEEAVAPSEMALLGLSGAGRRQRLAAGGQHLAIDQFTAPGRPYPETGDAASLCFQHLALVVVDIAAAFARLGDATPISINGPQQLPESSGGVRAFKFRDPDGHPLEFLQFPGHSDRSEALIRRIDHSAISVADVDESAAFYANLGLSPGPRTLNQGPEQERLDALPAVQVDVAPMNPRNPSPHLELLGYRTPRGTRGPERSANDVASTRVVWRGTGDSLLRDWDGHLHQIQSEQQP
ncbi:VOC family protein [Acidisphaera sp. L21]|uniref:VOC family protein n=1 Tax=Acidisphaera sp. L21 TaxID=1641851 RepID=UPI00131DCDE1|nr:VOC family protein [Acidisphaera sp. L21]